MRFRRVAFVLAMLFGADGAYAAGVVRVADLNTRQIRALDRARTLVILQGGMLEEHGPYLPAFTDGILSDRLALEVANGVAAKKPDWTVLLFPPVSVGASGYNEIGRQFIFPGTYAVRPSTLQTIYMDLADQLGEQGFKWIAIVHVHGSPMHIDALDDAGDYFRDTYGGRMVNLWGLLPVIGGWGTGMSGMTAAQSKEDGYSLHGGADEHSLMLHLQPNLVAADYQQAPTVTGASYAESVAAARRPDWPGYLGAPRVGNAALGRAIWTSFSAAALKATLEILDGADPARYPRYLPLMQTNPHYQEWIASATERDRTIDSRHESWNRRRHADATGDAVSQLASLEAAWNTAYLAGDAAALDRLWADDIELFFPRSRPIRKADALALVKNASAPFTRVETSDLHPRITGDIAVVTGRLQRTGPGPNARVVSDDWRFRKVYRRDPSGWRVISYHAWEPPK
jgi:creatinine amidohydrolase